MRKLKLIYVAPVLAIIALFAWSLASPIGAAPDDDFHLVSTWCAVADGSTCGPGDSANSRMVPEGVLHSPCYAFDATKSAACLNGLDFSNDARELTDRGNFVGAYPPVYYAFMHLFVGNDILASVVVMRLVNVLIFVGLTSALFWLLPPPRRQTLLLAWSVITVPMGIFLLSSNSPSGWAVVGVGTSWLALLGYMESQGARKWTLGAIAVIATIMAAGSRGDAAAYTVMGIGAVFILTVPGDRAKWAKYLRDAILPVAMVVTCIVFFALANQTLSGISGLSSVPSVEPGAVDGAGTAQGLQGFGRFAYNLLNIPFLWAGNFGEWGLGWLDTSLPSVVSFGAISCLAAVGFVGLSRLWGRKLIVVVVVGLAMWALPLYVLTRGGQIVGEAVQPRYVLPLIVLFFGLVLVTKRQSILSFSRVQAMLVGSTLVVVNAVALHMNMRRYITGTDYAGINLDHGIEWWWAGIPSPMVVWIVGSLAYAALLFIVLREVVWPRERATVALVEQDPQLKVPAVSIAT